MVLWEERRGDSGPQEFRNEEDVSEEPGALREPLAWKVSAWRGGRDISPCPGYLVLEPGQVAQWVRASCPLPGCTVVGSFPSQGT